MNRLDEIGRRTFRRHCAPLRPGNENASHVHGIDVGLPGSADCGFDRRMEGVRARHELDGEMRNDVPLLAEAAHEDRRIDVAAGKGRENR